MDEKSKSSQRKNRLMRHLPSDEQQQQQQQFSVDEYQRLIPLSLDHLASAGTILPKRRRCSITTDSTRSTSTEQNFIYDRTIPTGITVRKRPAQDDIAAYTTHHLLRDQDHHSNKRVCYEYSRSIELENQPPRSSITSQHSSILNHQPEINRRSSTWANLPIQHEMPLFFQDVLPPLSRTTTSVAAAATVYHERDTLSNHFSPLLTEDHHHSPHHLSSIFSSNSSRLSGEKHTHGKQQMRLLSTQSNENCPLRTTNFLLDNKQEQAILRTGNVSPAHSDSSSESTSTCSSDEPSHHHFSGFRNQYHHLLPQAQPWRTYRERENYEQLIDLAEKLSDPNRFKQVDVQQFFSYRYKIDPITPEALSKQTACVICMSHFKNGQHIRVLPCQHEYHSKCITRWFSMNSSCPICRRDNFL